MYSGAPNAYLEQDLIPLPAEGLGMDDDQGKEEWDSAFGTQLMGDPYAVENRVCRGVTMSYVSDFDEGLHSITGITQGGGEFGYADVGAKDGAGSVWDGHGAWSDKPMFQSTAVVSDMPKFTDSVHALELAKESRTNTCVCLNNATSAAGAARYAYELLATYYRSSITKVREDKFAVKATVFHEVGTHLAHCVLKLRVFRSPRASDAKEQGLTVQFRRNSGDAVAFHHVFHAMSRQLLRGYAGGREGLGAAAPDPGKLELPVLTAIPTPQTDAQPESTVQPLLDMMFNTTWPAGQVEAMIGLATVLATANAAVASVILSTLRNNQDVFKALCASPEFEVSYPAEVLASHLKHHSGSPMML